MYREESLLCGMSTPRRRATEERTSSVFKTTPSISEEDTISWVTVSTTAPIRASKPMALSLPARKPASLLTRTNASETCS